MARHRVEHSPSQYNVEIGAGLYEWGGVRHADGDIVYLLYAPNGRTLGPAIYFSARDGKYEVGDKWYDSLRAAKNVAEARAWLITRS